MKNLMIEQINNPGKRIFIKGNFENDKDAKCPFHTYLKWSNTPFGFIVETKVIENSIAVADSDFLDFLKKDATVSEFIKPLCLKALVDDWS